MNYNLIRWAIETEVGYVTINLGKYSKIINEALLFNTKKEAKQYKYDKSDKIVRVELSIVNIIRGIK